MKENLVMIRKNDAFTNSHELSVGFNLPHRDITNLLNKYKSEFEEWGKIAVELHKSNAKKAGRPLEIYYLNEPQAIYLGTMLKNSNEGRAFKKRLTNSFLKAKQQLAQLLSQKQNLEWLEKRAAGKIERRIETDVMKTFVEYAKASGSKNYNMYYMNITKMQNEALLAEQILLYPEANLRDVVDGFTLDALKMSDKIVSHCIEDGIRDQIQYKDLFNLIKAKVEGFAMAIGKTPLRLLQKKGHDERKIAY